MSPNARFRLKSDGKAQVTCLRSIGNGQPPTWRACNSSPSTCGISRCSRIYNHRLRPGETIRCTARCGDRFDPHRQDAGAKLGGRTGVPHYSYCADAAWRQSLSKVEWTASTTAWLWWCLAIATALGSPKGQQKSKWREIRRSTDEPSGSLAPSGGRHPGSNHWCPDVLSGGWIRCVPPLPISGSYTDFDSEEHPWVQVFPVENVNLRWDRGDGLIHRHFASAGSSCAVCGWCRA